MNKFLYKQLHRDHHIDTASKHMRIVAYETYTITWAETTSIAVASIAVSYVIGIGLVMLLKGGLGFETTAVCGVINVAPFSLFEFATLVSWGHNVELLGHTAMTSTPRLNPMRVAVELAGLDLRVVDHTIHHKLPHSNFAKQTALRDRAFGTFFPGDEGAVYRAGDELKEDKKCE